MQFICSINNKVTGALDAISGKIEKGGDFTAFNQNWQKKEPNLGICDLRISVS